MIGARVEKADRILTLVLDRVEKRNAITDAMYGTLADAISAAADDREARAILIRAEGEAFTAGNDIADFAKSGTNRLDGPRNVRRFLDSLAKSTKPIVAAVQGNAVGVGTTMLLHCDLVVLAENAVLITPFVNLGLVPEAASSHLLPARIGHVRAFMMFALGEPVNAEQAVAWGLCNVVVPLADLQSTATRFAERLVAQPAGALRAMKGLLRDPAYMLGRMEVESEEFAVRLRSPEAQEAFAAFAERRKPDFTKFA